jgi:hypothetical protein
MHNTRFNHRYRNDQGNRVPEGAGDRYWAQDLLRDMQYLRDRGGIDEMGYGALLRIGELSQGSDKLHVNIGPSSGIGELSVEVPDDSGGWSLPSITRWDTIKAIVRSTQINDFPIPETASGAVYLKYKEIDGGMRTRQYGAGDYPYYLRDGFELTTVQSEGCVKLFSYDNSGTELLLYPELSIADKIIKTALTVYRWDVSSVQTIIPLAELGMIYGKRYAVFISVEGTEEILFFQYTIQSDGLHIFAYKFSGGSFAPAVVKAKWGSNKWGEGKWGSITSLPVNILIKEL